MLPCRQLGIALSFARTLLVEEPFHRTSSCGFPHASIPVGGYSRPWKLMTRRKWVNRSNDHPLGIERILQVHAQSPLRQQYRFDSLHPADYGCVLRPVRHTTYHLCHPFLSTQIHGIVWTTTCCFLTRASRSCSPAGVDLVVPRAVLEQPVAESIRPSSVLLGRHGCEC